MKKLMACAFMLLGLSGCVTDGATPVGPRPETVEMLVRQGGEARFLGRAHGMDGWLVKLDDNVRAMYVAPDGKGVVVGLLHDGNGENLTIRQIEALALADKLAKAAETETARGIANVLPAEKAVEGTAVAAPVADPAQAAWEAAENLTYVSIGAEGAPVVYVMFDPRCSFCSMYLADLLEGPISTQKLNVRLLPVSVLGEDSVRMVASMLGAPVPAEAILRHAIGRGGELPAPTEENMAEVRHNSEVLSSLGLRSTPRTIYRTPAGEYGVVTGAPKDMAAFVGLVTGP
ncbi:MAG TPA: hypothetical protein DCW68_07800 [Rhodospirillaceae bacterium]|nr:hypothetical protein [Rhodospirillaceae bacterium]